MNLAWRCEAVSLGADLLITVGLNCDRKCLDVLFVLGYPFTFCHSTGLFCIFKHSTPANHHHFTLFNSQRRSLVRFGHSYSSVYIWNMGQHLWGIELVHDYRVTRVLFSEQAQRAELLLYFSLACQGFRASHSFLWLSICASPVAQLLFHLTFID